MARQFPGNPCRAVAVRVEVVDRADVIEATAGDVITARGICAGHDPGRAERDGVHLVGRVSVPDDQFTILGRRDQMSPISRPVHSINLGKMAL